MHMSSLMKFFCVPRNTQLRFVRALSYVNRSSGKDHYKTLELDKGCSDKDVRNAYIRLSKEHHPDMNPDKQSATSEKRFIEINEAYSVLSKPASRRRYDSYLREWEVPQFSSTYEELTYHYNQRNQYARRRNAPREEAPIPVNRILFFIITAVFFIGILEFNIIKRVVQKPDEIVDGIPIYHSRINVPDTSGMTEEQQLAYHSEKRRIIRDAVRSMKVERESRQREQDRLKNFIQANKERQSNTGIVEE